MSSLSDALERGGEERERARRELADFIASIAFIGQWGAQDTGIKNAVAAMPEARRQQFIEELRSVATDVGWEDVDGMLRGESTFDHEVRRAVDIDPSVKLYEHAIRHPKDIERVQDFITGAGTPAHYWVPRKVDIRRYVRVAELAHFQSGRTGPVRILDVGGGSGLLAKLIADEARVQGLEVEVVVVDPDERTIGTASRTYADTPAIRFEVGTARDALLRHGPEPSPLKREELDALEREQGALIARGREEIASIKATLAAIEGADSMGALVRGPFGETAELIFREAGVDPQMERTIESVRNAVAQHYVQRFKFFRHAITEIRDRQEHLLLLASRDPRSAEFDVVVNSWMPSGLDFTREIRSIGAPAIIYALESSGATGASAYREGPGDVGLEESYQTGHAYRTLTGWDGIATSKFYVGDDGAVKYLRMSSVGQHTQVQCRKGFAIQAQDIGRIPPVSDTEKYPWERSLEELAGKQEIEWIDKSFD
jgi:hypothetical protein